MNKTEKSILLLVTLAVTAKVLFVFGIYVLPHISKTSAVFDTFSWNTFVAMLTVLINVGAALWIYLEAKAIGLRAWVWCLLGLLFGAIGVILYFAAHIYARSVTPQVVSHD